MSLFQEVVNLAPYLPAEIASTAASLPEPGILADFIAAHLNLRLEERQAILDTLDVAERLRQVTELLQREKEILEIGRKAQQEMSKAQREYVLRQQMEAIRRELGETDERQAEVNALRERLQQAQLPEEARKEVERELSAWPICHPAQRNTSSPAPIWTGFSTSPGRSARRTTWIFGMRGRCWTRITMTWSGSKNASWNIWRCAR